MIKKIQSHAQKAHKKASKRFKKAHKRAKKHYKKHEHHIHLGGVSCLALIMLAISSPFSDHSYARNPEMQMYPNNRNNTVAGNYHGSAPQQRFSLTPEVDCIAKEIVRENDWVGVHPGGKHIMNQYRQTQKTDSSYCPEGYMAVEAGRHGSAFDVPVSFCGNGIVEDNEECDGSIDCMNCLSVQRTWELMDIMAHAGNPVSSAPIYKPHKEMLLDATMQLLEQAENVEGTKLYLAHTLRKDLMNAKNNPYKNLHKVAIQEYLFYVVSKYGVKKKTSQIGQGEKEYPEMKRVEHEEKKEQNPIYKPSISSSVKGEKEEIEDQKREEEATRGLLDLLKKDISKKQNKNTKQIQELRSEDFIVYIPSDWKAERDSYNGIKLTKNKNDQTDGFNLIFVPEGQQLTKEEIKKIEDFASTKISIFSDQNKKAYISESGRRNTSYLRNQNRFFVSLDSFGNLEINDEEIRELIDSIDIIALRNFETEKTEEEKRRRDLKRHNDIKQLASAILTYELDNGKYPSFKGSTEKEMQGGVASELREQIEGMYLRAIPTDPGNINIWGCTDPESKGGEYFMTTLKDMNGSTGMLLATIIEQASQANYIIECQDKLSCFCPFQGGYKESEGAIKTLQEIEKCDTIIEESSEYSGPCSYDKNRLENYQFIYLDTYR